MVAAGSRALPSPSLLSLFNVALRQMFSEAPRTAGWCRSREARSHSRRGGALPEELPGTVGLFPASGQAGGRLPKINAAVTSAPLTVCDNAWVFLP